MHTQTHTHTAGRIVKELLQVSSLAQSGDAVDANLLQQQRDAASLRFRQTAEADQGRVEDKQAAFAQQLDQQATQQSEQRQMTQAQMLEKMEERVAWNAHSSSAQPSSWTESGMVGNVGNAGNRGDPGRDGKDGELSDAEGDLPKDLPRFKSRAEPDPDASAGGAAAAGGGGVGGEIGRADV